jgi:transposase
MLKTRRRINSKPKFSEEFKRKLVEDFEKGVMSVIQMEQYCGMANKSIFNQI